MNLRFFHSFLIFLLSISIICAQGGDNDNIDDEIPDEEVVDSSHIKDGKTKRKFKERKAIQLDGLFVGANFSLFFGYGAVTVDFAPYAGYRIGKVFAVGVGVPYQYNYFTSVNSSAHVYGVRAFMRLRPFGGLDGFLSKWYLHGEGEYLTAAFENKNAVPPTPKYTKYSAPAVNVGLGYTTNFEKGWGFTTEILFNALYYSQKNNSSTPDPITNFFHYRIGFYYGF